jgi:hypothetical protein
MVSLGEEPSDAEFGSYGLDQCMDLVEGALARGDGVAPPPGDDWLVGQGLAIAMHDTAPPTEHRSEARLGLAPMAATTSPSAPPSSATGLRPSHAQIVATTPRHDDQQRPHRPNRHRPHRLRHRRLRQARDVRRRQGGLAGGGGAAGPDRRLRGVPVRWGW